MNPLRHWKVILTVVLVFGAGAVTGSVATMLHFKHAFEQGLNWDHMTAKAMQDLQRDLRLTPAQQPKIRAILEATTHQIKRSFEQAAKVSGTNLVASWNQIDQELTPQQRVIFQRKCQKFREGLKKNLKMDLPPQ